MDPDAVGGMIFTLILTFMIGGFILLFPLSRRLGALIDARLADRKTAPPAMPDAELAALRESIADLNTQIDRIADRQDFMEKLLTQRIDPRPLARPASDSALAP